MPSVPKSPKSTVPLTTKAKDTKRPLHDELAPVVVFSTAARQFKRTELRRAARLLRLASSENGLPINALIRPIDALRRITEATKIAVAQGDAWLKLVAMQNGILALVRLGCIEEALIALARVEEALKQRLVGTE